MPTEHWVATISWIGAGLVAGVINTIAGGGSLLTLPILIFWGLPAPFANATNRVGILMQSLVAVATFVRSGVLNVRTVLPRLISSILGAMTGAYLATQIDPNGFRYLIGWIFLGFSALLVFRPLKNLRPQKSAPLGIQVVVFFFLGAYGGFLQAGLGLFLLAASISLAGEELSQANAAKNLMVFSFTGPALCVFASHGLVNLKIGVFLGLGAMLGGYIGAKLSLRISAETIRPVLIGLVLIFSTRLIGLW